MFKNSVCTPNDGLRSNYLMNGTKETGSQIEATLLAIKSTMDTTNHNIHSMEECLNKKCEDLNKTINSSIAGLRGEFNSKIDDISQTVEINNLKLSKKCDELSSQVNFIEWQSHLNKIIIAGVPYTANEKTSEIIEILFNEIQYGHGILSVDTIIRAKPNGRGVGVILVKFATLGYKREFYRCLKEHKGALSTSALGFAFNAPIYINDSLDKRNAEIFRMARRLVKEKSIFKCFVKNGYVYIKAWDGGDVHKVNSVAQLTLLDITGALENNVLQSNGGGGKTRDTLA